MRYSNNQYNKDSLINGFDYELQVWVINGIIQNCGHPEGTCNCNARKYKGQTLASVKQSN